MNSDRRFIALGLLLAVVLVLILASCRESLGYTRLVWADEFDSTSYTMSHWRLGPDPGAAPAPGSLSLTPEGTLTLKIGANTSYKWTNVSTMGPWSTTEPNYPHATTFEEGYFEARLRYSSNEWVWPAFWLFSANTQEAFPGKCDGGSGKLTSEIDILDAGEFSGDPSQPDHYFGGIHENTWAGTVPWCGIADNVQTTDRHLAGKDLTQWHVWSAEWTSEKVDVYVDDELIATWDTYDSTAQPMSLLFSLSYGPCNSCGPKPSELTMEVDWVRAWAKPRSAPTCQTPGGCSA